MNLIPIDCIYRGEVAQRWKVEGKNGFEIGFISSVSQPFCGDCTRARISSDGHLFTCLFASTGTNLKSILRNEKNIDQTHVSFNQLVNKETIQHFLYRDFPDKLTENQPQVKIQEQVKIKINPEMEKKMRGSYTVNEIVKSMKEQYPDIWK